VAKLFYTHKGVLTHTDAPHTHTHTHTRTETEIELMYILMYVDYIYKEIK